MKTPYAALVMLALLLGACGQPGSQQPTPVTPPVQTDKASATVTVTLPATPQGGLRPSYVPGTTRALRIRLGATDVTRAIGENEPGCTLAEGKITCSFTLAVAAGNTTLKVQALDASNRILAEAEKDVRIELGRNNPLKITLFGVPESVELTFDRLADVSEAGGVTLLDRGGEYHVGVALIDASGQIILDPGRPNDLLCSDNPAFVVSGSKGSFTLEAPEPVGEPQNVSLRVVSGESCASGKELKQLSVQVPKLQVDLRLSNTEPIAGDSILANASLLTARGRPLNIAGRNVVFGATGASVAQPSATTDSTGQVSVSVVTASTVGTGTVTATSSGVSATASFSSRPGQPNPALSTITLEPDSVRVRGTATLTVTLKDGNGNPITSEPEVRASVGSAVLTTQVGNVFTYSVTAPATPGIMNLQVSHASQTVGERNLEVTPYALRVLDGGVELPRNYTFNFASDVPKAFTVLEEQYTGAFIAESSNTDVATVQVSGNTLTVTPGTQAGLAQITVRDAHADPAYVQTVQFDVSVTTVTLEID
ncbi:hypothetical protein HNR42_003452 [Deinobacterium chartae]|uniref:Big-1 domain-containing protein n=1 Tax=Deinobacterium chartae TaxID=521158 RepID=A0A841I2E6_9DEIO|nr:hypothetical protein [Deinobacterium chartae]MBB6099991.1 hypothetical protein [Deinobacterium chartae]